MKTSGYNIMRDDSALLEDHEKSPPSFSVRLFPDHWTLNSGPKFAYNNQVSTILEDIRAFRIPTDFLQIFDDAGVPYYSGCLIVEILDYRPAKAKEPILERPDKQRVVLRPNAETIWADICAMRARTGSKWSDVDALKVESKLLLSTATPLCLEPDPSLGRIVNSILRVSTPNVPNSLKRKAAAMVDLEEDETEKAKRAKIMQFMNPQFSTARKPFQASYKILSLLEQQRSLAPAPPQQPSQGTASAPVADNAPSGTMAPPNLSNIYQQIPDKSATTVAPTLTTTYSQLNTISQPVPVAMPRVQVPPQLQQVVDPSQRQSPAKQQQMLSTPAPQRPPSQPVVAPQANTTVPPPQTQGQQPRTQTPSQFNPPIPPTNFLNAPPQNRRRLSVAVKPGTPAVTNTPLPVQQATNQAQPQVQAQAQTQAQPQPQQQQPHQQQAPAQPQLMQPQSQPVRPAQIPANMPSIQNMAQFYASGRATPLAQATAATIAAQRQAMSGRNTPLNVARPSASPVPPPSAVIRSPMMQQAAIAAMMSRQNTPVAAGNPIARGSPLAPAALARGVAAQSASQQQQATQPIPGVQPVLTQQSANALAYHQYQQQQQRFALYQQAQAQAAQMQALQQAQMHQQRQVSPAPQNQNQIPQQNQNQNPQQQQQQPGNVQVQVQPPTVQQPYPGGVQMAPQQYNNIMHQQLMWAAQQRAMSRGVVPMQPNGQAPMPPGMSMQQMRGLGRGGGLPNR